MKRPTLWIGAAFGIGLLLAQPTLAQVVEFGSKVPSLEELRAAMGGAQRYVVHSDPGDATSDQHAPPSGYPQELTPPPPPQPGHPTQPAAQQGFSVPVEFGLNSAEVMPSFMPHLARVAELMQVDPGLSIRIVGHADARGDDYANWKLSQHRAGSVRDVLVLNHGIDRSRIITEGRGESQPIVSNPYSPRNRRVEFHPQ